MARSLEDALVRVLARSRGGSSLRPRHGRGIAALLGVVSVMGAIGCQGDYVAPAGPTDPSHLLAAVVLDHHAIVLSTTAPWNTLQLTATPMNADGAPLTALSPATYSVSDSGSVGISADGTVTGLAPASAVLLIAAVHDGNLTVKDTAYIYVTDPPAPPATFSIQPLPGDSAKVAAEYFFPKQITVQATDSSGAPIDALPAFFSSADPTIATVDPVTGFVNAIRPGTVKIRASTTAYGVSLSDSLVLTVTAPLFGVVNADERTPVGSTTPELVFDPTTLTVSVGASVFFVTNSTLSTDVVFDDSTDVSESPFFPSGGGNIPPFHADPGSVNGAARAFFKPGTYTYHSTLYDTQGTIIVQ